jgi:hypothetical protein
VNERRVLLIETLDAAGSSPSDALVRLETAKKAGFDVEACVYDARPPELLDHHESAQEPRGVTILHGDEALADRLERSRDRLLIVASAAAGGGDLARRIPSGMAARWWPTGIGPWSARGPRRSPGLEPLDHCAEAGPRSEACPSAGLNWSVIEGTVGGRRRLAPWDGEYLLVPVPVSARAGKLLLRVFATVAEVRDALDLVFLAPPMPELLQEARRLAVGPRVHFAGSAPRPAEYAWCHAASVVLVNATLPLSGGVVLRALASNAPVLAFGAERQDGVLRAWLEQAGCALTLPGHGAPELSHALSRLLERGPQVEHTLTRGRATAVMHQVDAVAPRLRVALRLDSDQRRRAA